MESYTRTGLLDDVMVNQVAKKIIGHRLVPFLLGILFFCVLSFTQKAISGVPVFAPRSYIVPVAFGGAMGLVAGEWFARQKAAAAELDEKNQYLNAIFDNATTGIVLIDAETYQIVDINEYACRVSGFSKDDLIGSECQSLLCPSCYRGLCKNLDADLTSTSAEGHLLQSQGEPSPILKRVTALTLGDKNYLLETFVDITPQKEAERALQARQHELDAIVSSINAYIWSADVIDGELRYRYYSPVTKAITGYSPEFMAQGVESWLSIIHPEDRERIRARLPLELAGDVVRHDYRVIRPDGEIRWLTSTVTPTLDENGDVVQLYGVALDVTDRKNLEAQMRQAQKMEAIGLLAGGVAHDFNNILTVITGYSGLLTRLLTEDPRLKNYAVEIDKAAQRAAGLTNQLLAFSRKQLLQPEVIDLNHVVTETDAMLRRLIGENIEIDVILDPNLHPVKVDPGQIQQVVMNLSVNARDAMPTGGTLTISTQNITIDESFAQLHPELTPGPHVRLSIQDTGHGIEEEVLAHIFEPFFTTKDIGQGTGLGLAMVHGIVAQSNGLITVESEIDRGTTFHIFLPKTGEQHTQAKNGNSASISPSTRATILLVEDEDSVRSLTSQVLQSEGHTVLTARNGNQALYLSRSYKKQIDLILTDMIMPGGLNGKELADQLLQERPEAKILYMSGYSQAELARQKIGPNPNSLFIAKPFTPQMLKEKIDMALT